MAGRNYNVAICPDFNGVGNNNSQTVGWVSPNPGTTTKRYMPANMTGTTSPCPVNNVAEFSSSTAVADGTLVLVLWGPSAGQGNTTPPAGDRIMAHCCAAVALPDAGMTQPTLMLGNNSTRFAPETEVAIPWTDVPYAGSDNLTGATTFPVTVAPYTLTASLRGVMYWRVYDAQRPIYIAPYSMFYSIATGTENFPPGPVGDLTGQQVNAGGVPTVELSWSAPALVDTAHGSVLAGYNVYRDNVLVSNTQTATTYTDATTLTPNQIYAYRVVPVEGKAAKPAGLGANPWEGCPNVWRHRVVVVVDQPPTAPTGVNVEPKIHGQSENDVTDTTINIRWQPGTDDVSIYGYNIYRATTNTGPLVLVKSAPKGDYEWHTPNGHHTWLDTGLTPNRLYWYAVSAVDSIGQEGPQSVRSAGIATLTTDPPPTAPTNLVAEVVSETSVRIAWDAATDPAGGDPGLWGYAIWRDGEEIRGASDDMGNTQLVRRYVDSPLWPGTTYVYTVQAEDFKPQRGPHSEPLTVTTNPDTTQPPDTIAPSTPTDLHSTSQSYTTISLAWTGSTDDQALAGYHVYEGATKIYTTAATSYQDRDLAQGTTHTYTVTAFDDAGNESGHSNSVTATTDYLPIDGTAPSTPADLHTTGHTYTTISLAWTPATDNVGVTGYRVYESGILLATTPATPCTYTATGLENGSTHSYTVKAVDAAGNQSAHSNTATDTTDISVDTTPPTVPAGLAVTAVTHNTVSLDWEASTDTETGVAGYNIYVGATMVNGAPVAATAGDVGGLAPTTNYTFTVTGVDAAGNESAHSAAVSATTLDAPIPPTPVGDPWEIYADLAATLAPRVASHAGVIVPGTRRDAAVSQATEHIPVVATYVHGYTRGSGWVGGAPDGPLCAVIVAAAARLLNNPEQLFTYTVGDYSERPAVLTGWTLAERAVLHRYRRISA